MDLNGKSLAAPDTADLLRLANDLHRLPAHPTARKQQFLDGLAKLTGAVAGACIVSHDDDDGESAVSVTLTSNTSRSASPPKAARGKPRDAERRIEPHPLVRQIRRSMGFKRNDAGPALDRGVLCSVVRLDRPRTSAGLALARRHGDHRPFSQRDALLVALFHHEMRWIYQFDLPLMSPDVMQLSPRARQTLQSLLAGLSEKEIAGHLGLSLNTVHHYVKQLYRHFHVTSRSQLLARWVGE